METVLAPSSLTYTTLLTVIVLLLDAHIVVESAYFTVVNSEVFVASLTCCGFGLDQVATKAFDVSDSMSVHAMVLI